MIECIINKFINKEGSYMKYKHGKIFKKASPKIVELAAFDYVPSTDEYYTFVRKQREAGYRQVIITSEMMIKLMKKYFLERKFRIASVEFMIEDGALENQVHDILKKLNGDRGYFNLLIDKLTFLVEETSIDIKKVEFKRREDNHSLSLHIQVNGIFGVNEADFDDESEVLIRAIEGCM